MEDLCSAYIITMKTSNNKTLYLTINNDKYEWTFNKSNSLWFTDYNDIEKFCKQYFKHFNKWEIVEILY